MPRCGCAGSSCSCLIQGVELDCITVGVSGLGTQDAPYKVWAELDLDCLPEELVGGDTDCMSVSVTGGVITAEPIFDPDTLDCLSCGPSGIRLLLDADTLTCGPSGLTVVGGGGGATFFDVIDTDCIDLEITGDGSVGDPFELSADLIIHPDYLDCLSCSPSGLQLILDADTLSCGVSGLTVVGGSPGAADETLFWTLAGGI